MARIRQLVEAFRQLRGIDPKAGPLVLVGLLVGALVGVGLGLLVAVWVAILFGVLLGLLGAMFVFSRRAQRAQYTMIEGQPGAAAAILQTMRGQWFVTPAVAYNAKQDLVHRVVGRCGVVLIGEGAPQRTKLLLAKERKRTGRAAGDAPVTTLLIGDGEDQVPVKKLQLRLTKLPRSLSKSEVPRLERRLKPLDKGFGIPQGIDPNVANRPRPKPR